MPNPIFKSTITQSIGRYFNTGTDEFPPGLITASIEQEFLCGNENVKLYEGAESCANNDPIYFISKIGDPDFRLSEEMYENDFEQRNLKSRVVVPRMKFSFNIDTSVRGALYKMISENDELRIDFETTWTNRIIKNVEIEDDEEQNIGDGNYWYMTLSFEMPTLPATGTTPCCNENVYQEAPYEDDCPPDPPDPEACDLLSISLENNDGTIELTVDNPFGSPSSVWTFAPYGGGSPINLGNNLTSVVPPAYGTVTVNYSVGSCKKGASIVYLDPCTGFAVSIINSAGVLDASVPAMHDPVDTYGWEYSEDGSSWAALGSDQEQIATEGEGYYRVTVNKGDCEASSTLFVSEADICIIEGNIDKDGNVLSFNGAAEGMTYQWYIQLDDTISSIPGATLEEYTATESGFYYVDVTDGDCTVRFSRNHIMCGDCATFSAEVTDEGGTLTASVDGCAEPTYEWLYVDGGVKTVVGDEEEYTPEDDGLYFLEVCCGECTPKVFIIMVADGTITITDNTLPSGGGWGL